MPDYVFTKEHRERLSESLKGVRNAVGPHQMSPRGRANLQLAQLRRWKVHYTKRAREETDALKKQKLQDKAASTADKIEKIETKIRRYWGGE